MKIKNNKNIAIILAAGQGSRFGKEIQKSFVKIAGREVIVHTLEKFEEHEDVDGIIIVTRKNLIEKCRSLVQEQKFKKVLKIVIGGDTRQQSSWVGINSCVTINPQNILFHDAVRPFVSHRIISDIVKKLDDFPAVDVAIRSPDTLIRIDNERVIREIPKRSYILRGQTPQGFRFSVIKKAHEMALKDGFREVTDDCGLVLRYNLGKIYVVNGEDENIKITYPIDIHIADKIFQIKNVNFNEIKEVAFDLTGKKVLIFGHSSGIGKEIYRICKESSAEVVGYSLPNLDITDFLKVESIIKKTVRELGLIDIFVSTAGILKRENLIDFPQKEIRKQIEVNYIAQVNIIKEILPFMTRGGSMALFTSSSYTRGRGTYSIYSSTKAAIVNFVQAISEEVFDQGIKINAICPARTNTPMRRENFGREPDDSLLDPKVVARATIKTCLSNLTGQVININKK